MKKIFRMTPPDPALREKPEPKNAAPSEGLQQEMESAIFETAMSIRDAETRRGYLDRSFQGDPHGLTRMEELLDMAGESSVFFMESQRQRAKLAEDALSELPDEDHIDYAAGMLDSEGLGEVVDGYKLIRRLGEGGCGIVYEAELERVNRRAALKIIRLGMDTEAVVARFAAERQALEMMDHPNIAKVLDAGKTPSGRPYFVMELVRGERITTWCHEEKLDVPARLRLFIQVCQAIQHAHQKGIIHRDIKPSNVLVTSHDGVPVPKVIDFGIAKATGNSFQNRGVVTASDQLIGTPVYMSPEQIDMAGLDVDTRSDIYSLGALLYELLCDQSPFDAEALMKSGMSAMRRTLLEEDPPLPSEVLAAATAEGNSRREQERQAASLRCELDWIVIKAMDKDRGRRYQTVNSLAMDVRRYLAHEPVIARRPSRIYLLQKFFRRNRVACISGIAVAMSLVGGLGAATVLYLRERSAFVEQERLKQEAEAARSRESYLRGQAQARANLSRVAILVSEGKVQEADQLLQQNPLDSIDPSTEAAEIFRFLGNWNSIYQRWEQALACFTLMNQASKLSDPGRIAEGSDLLMTAPVYLELGDTRGYAKFREQAIERCVDVKNSLQAEHVLKICLLTPADQSILERLKPVEDICKAAIPPPGKTASLRDWDALSISLYRYRLGDYQGALEWTRKCLFFKDTVGSRSSAARCISAMAHFRLGHMKEAQEDLKFSRTTVESVNFRPDDSQSPPPGYWFAWAVSRILLREASELIEG